jgi:hypothetical protein
MKYKGKLKRVDLKNIINHNTLTEIHSYFIIYPEYIIGKREQIR